MNARFVHNAVFIRSIRTDNRCSGGQRAPGGGLALDKTKDRIYKRSIMRSRPLVWTREPIGRPPNKTRSDASALRPATPRPARCECQARSAPDGTRHAKRQYTHDRRASSTPHRAVRSEPVSMLHDAWPGAWHRAETFELDALIAEVNNNCMKGKFSTEAAFASATSDPDVLRNIQLKPTLLESDTTRSGLYWTSMVKQSGDGPLRAFS